MKTVFEILGEKDERRIVLTDSGLGGLTICAALENRLRTGGGRGRFDLVYVNAWPDAGHGYNDLPDAAGRAAVFDRALAAMARFRPDLVVIACNTLSVLYGMTAFARSGAVPAAGIIDAGVDLFARALSEDPKASLMLFGTRTTIESGEHARRLARLGIDPRRIRAAACHGLAAVIDKNPDDPALPGLVDECVSRALAGNEPAGKLCAGLVCTHYAYVADLFRRALGRSPESPFEVLDPAEGLVSALAAGLESRGEGGTGSEVGVEVVSKVELPEAQRRAVARRLEAVSPATARALLAYAHEPGLF